MTSDRFDAVVAEYLHEIEQRLHGLPVVQRRELLGDLEAHILNERAERGVTTETELLHVLERLGSPDVLAAAAYEEAGLPQPTMPLPAVSVGSAPMPAAVPETGGQVFAGTVSFAANSRFSGRAERTAPVDTAEVAAMVAASVGPDPAAQAPASVAAAPGPEEPASASNLAAPASASASAAPVSATVSVAPAPASAPPAWVPPMPTPQAYVPPAPAAVIPPPDDLRRTRPGPFPPSGPGRPGRPFRPPASAPPPFVGGPPLAPPPMVRRPASGGTWMRALVAGVVALMFVLALGCLGGAFLLRSDVSDSGPAAVVPEPVAPFAPAEPADATEPTATEDAADPTATATATATEGAADPTTQSTAPAGAAVSTAD
ncbi:hypothetical protein AB0J80_10850 [Actinoplanes sp. NPDC049548]|uniref:HAAS signaling domain-containing protein n=1 Tax=Actinoplanes sp. NPDC049548 TaxID=3155152 RepID=UPI003413A14A